MVAESLAAEVGFGQVVALDERSSRSVEHKDPLLQERPDQEQALIARPGVAGRRFFGWRRRRNVGQLVGRCRGDVRFGGPASFFAQCTGETERGPNGSREWPADQDGLVAPTARR